MVMGDAQLKDASFAYASGDSRSFEPIKKEPLPTEWSAVLLESIATVTSGKRLPKGNFLTTKPTPYPYIRVSDMRQGTIDLSDIRFVPGDVAPAIRNYRIFKDDLFISVAGTLGIVGSVPEVLDGANLTENADRITDIRCSQRYLMHVLMSPAIQRIIEEVRTVGAQPKLALERIRRFPILLPADPKEQSSIAEALDDADDHISSINKLIQKKRLIKQGAMQELLSGRRRLPGFSDKWLQQRLGNSALLKARIGWQGLTTAEYMEAGHYALVTGTEFQSGKISWNDCYFVEEKRYKQDPYIQLRRGDVLVTKDGTIGKVAYVDSLPKPATLNSGVFVIRPIDYSFDPKFFFYLLVSRTFIDFLSKLSAGSTINHLYQKDFVDFTYDVPPTLKEQRAIASVLSDIDADISALEARLEKARQIKKGMMQELLTGRVRLI